MYEIDLIGYKIGLTDWQLDTLEESKLFSELYSFPTYASPMLFFFFKGFQEWNCWIIASIGDFSCRYIHGRFKSMESMTQSDAVLDAVLVCLHYREGKCLESFFKVENPLRYIWECENWAVSCSSMFILLWHKSVHSL